VEGLPPGEPVIVAAGMQGERASVVFAARAEINSFIKQSACGPWRSEEIIPESDSANTSLRCLRTLAGAGYEYNQPGCHVSVQRNDWIRLRIQPVDATH